MFIKFKAKLKLLTFEDIFNLNRRSILYQILIRSFSYLYKIPNPTFRDVSVSIADYLELLGVSITPTLNLGPS